MTRVHTVNDDQGLVDVLPLLFGFMPKDSLAMIEMKGPRMHFRARVDLGYPDATLQAVEAMQAQEPEAVLLIAVGEPEAAAAALDHALMLLGDVVIKMVAAPNQEVPSGEIMDYADELGKNEVFQTREALEAAWTHIGGDIPEVTVEERDEMFASMLQAEKVDAVMWQEQARRCEVPSAHLYVLAAVAHYLNGDGAKANMGIEKARAIEADHTMANLIAQVLLAGITPEQFRAIGA